ncbi:MAG: type IV pilin protein [Zoogloeaceae bacterium]|nr:type IV pilin protein [Zoogloeaceae bacterium]
MKRTRRAECQSVLMHTAGMLERQYSATNDYTKLTDLPTKCPRDGSAKFYDVVPTRTVDTFTLTATPFGDQSGDTKCNILALDHRGTKYQGDGTQPNNGCW